MTTVGVEEVITGWPSCGIRLPSVGLTVYVVVTVLVPGVPAVVTLASPLALVASFS